MLPQQAFRHMAVILVAVFVVACEPVYRTAYTFTPPASEQGRICVSQCEASHRTCYPMCGGTVEAYTYSAANCEE